MNKYLIYSVLLRERNSNGDHTNRFITVVDQLDGINNQPAVYLDYAKAQEHKNKMQRMYPDEAYEVQSSWAYTAETLHHVETHPITPKVDESGSLTAG